MIINDDLNAYHYPAISPHDVPLDTPPAQPTPTMSENLAQVRKDMIHRCTEAAQDFGHRLMFGMTTSLTLQSIPVPSHCALDLDVLHTVSSVKDKRLRTRRPSMQAHTWKPLVQADNVRINRHVYALDLIHTWAQLAPHVPLESLVSLGDSILHAQSITSSRSFPGSDGDHDSVRRRFITTITSLPRFRAKPQCLLALTLIRANVASPMESKSRMVLLKHGIPSPSTGYTVPDARFVSGATMTLDMAWPEYQMAVEYDGDHHRTDKAQWRRDQEKREWLRNRGWTVIIATGADVKDDVSKAEYAFNVARHLALRGATFDFSVLPRSIEEVAKQYRKSGSG